jgi:hypothetical protein
MKLDRARANRPHRQSGMTASVLVDDADDAAGESDDDGE